MTPRISVITPVYNGMRFIESCINNVIAQECPAVEHVIADGGSTDGTVDVIRRYAEKFPHIRWVSEKDRGQSDAMNKGIGMATGEIIGFLNVDDYYEPGATLPQVRGVLLELSLVPLYEGQHLWLELMKRLEAEGFVLWAFEPVFSDPLDGRTLQVDGIFYRNP